MKKIFILLLFLTFNIISKGQDNLPLKFKNYEPKWIDFIHLEHYPLNENNIYELQGNPKAIEDSLFLFYNIVNFGYNGIIIEKRNIKDGSLYWRFERDTIVEKARISLSRAYMNENNIELILSEEDKYLDDSTVPDWAGSHPATMTLSRNEGNIVYEHYTNHLDSSNIVLKPFGDFNLGHSERSLKLLKTKNGYRQIYYLMTQKSYYITDVDSLGHLIKKDTLFLPSPYRVVSHKLYDMDDSTFFSVIISTSDEHITNDEIEIVYRKMDHNLNILKEVDITSQIPDMMKSANTFREDNGYFIIVSGFHAQDHSYSSLRYYLFNTEGVFKDKIIYTIRAGEDVEYGWLNPIVDIENERLILSLSRQDLPNTSTYFELFTSNGDQLDLMRRFEVEGTEDHFRVNYGTMLSSGDLLLYIAQFDWDANPMYPYPINWYSLMLMSKDDLVSSKVVSNKPNADILLYPNPTIGKVNVKSTDELESINVFDNNAKILYYCKGNKELDLTSLPKGIYNVMIEQKNGAIFVKRIVVQ